MRMIWAFVALGSLAACSPQVPDSGAGIGFDSYDRRAQQARDAQLAGGLPGAAPVSAAALPPAGAISDEPLDATNLAARTQAMLAQTAAATDGEAVQASPANPGPAQLENPGISDENDFSAVGDRRTIADDQQRRAQLKAQYQQVQPSALPERNDSGPNIVAYALQTSNPIGQRIYRRSGFNALARFQRNCPKYGSPDLAQADFLARGGPKRDRRGLDPDGDGYACDWDPRPFRKARSE